MQNYCTIKTDGKKWCHKCKEYKDCSEFYPNKSKKDGLHTECKKCHLLACKKYRSTEDYKESKRKTYRKYKNRDAPKRQKYYQKNKGKILNKQEKHRKARMEWFFKEVGSYCRMCGYNKTIIALQLHHLDNEQKKDGNDLLANWIKWTSLDRFKGKINSIDFTILCANCHAEVHGGRIIKEFKPIKLRGDK